MNHVYIEDVARHVGEEITIKGWLYNMRSSGKLMFPQVRDGSGIIQGVVFKKNVPEQVWNDFEKLTQESSIIVNGKVRADERAPGGYELDVTGVQVLQIAQAYPITPKEHGVEFLMDNRHLWLRSKRQHAILSIRAEVIRAVRDFFDSNGFLLMDTPIFTPAACEGTTTLFEVDYFEDAKAYLTQSGQLYNEATAAAFGKVYCFGPTFRAEKSKTRRHLTEFWMIEPEVAFATHADNLVLQEGFVSAIVQRCLERRGEELKVLERDTATLARCLPPFPRITYDDALQLIADHQGEVEGATPLPWGEDFGAPHETLIASHFDKPVFVERYPSAIKAFYMEPDPARPEVALCADLLAPEGYGEIIGGSQRIHDVELLEQRIKEHGLNVD